MSKNTKGEFHLALRVFKLLIGADVLVNKGNSQSKKRGLSIAAASEDTQASHVGGQGVKKARTRAVGRRR
jgi:hypothetical protein